METDNDGDNDTPGASDIFKLQTMQAGVNTTARAELCVRADLQYFAVTHHHDTVGIFNC